MNEEEQIPITEFDSSQWTAKQWEGIAFTETPLFPININICGTDFQLNIDGSWTGDIAVIKKAMAEAKLYGANGQMGIMLWLMLREMERDTRLGW